MKVCRVTHKPKLSSQNLLSNLHDNFSTTTKTQFHRIISNNAIAAH